MIELANLPGRGEIISPQRNCKKKSGLHVITRAKDCTDGSKKALVLYIVALSRINSVSTCFVTVGHCSN